ncbi:two component transcriptional regulator, LuxR family [Cryptosporangium aurantiacum]|uniref:Two component transcriptional regulator, LuxR family n=2 Tax=Cryptosporangium aurantiacum TaxID=134849 RepID=A0A1M7RP36_9ACTN|nr:response regulator transcription factor [Cryptosporangium aurantiacum]SHN48107.1 two component transcriptional regulator, LuxR family [Cryptosporangium aurantiacum]
MLAEDSALLRVGLERLVADEGHDVVASVGDADALLAAVAAGPPDVVVVDVRMPPTHTDEGLRAALRIRERWPAVGVLVLSQYVEKRYAAELLGSTASGIGYLLKDRVVRVEEFLDALNRVGAGGAAFDPEVVRQLLARPAHADPLAALTGREREVLGRMAEGQTNGRIGSELSISQSAVEKHVNAIFDKLGLSAEGGYSRRVLAVLRYLGA